MTNLIFDSGPIVINQGKIEILNDTDCDLVVSEIDGEHGLKLTISNCKSNCCMNCRKMVHEALGGDDG